MIDQSAEELAISLMFREHLAELRDWYRKNDENGSTSKTTEIKGGSGRPKTNRNICSLNWRENW